MSLKLPTLSLKEFKKHLRLGRGLIDVRAPIEFELGSIPGSVNFPILDNEERALIGTCYKHNGQEEAIKLGYQTVSGKNKACKQEKWIAYLNENPDAIVTCFRGGLRSQITQQFLAEAGFVVPRLEKGYKQARQFFLQEMQSFCDSQDMILLTGLTGSAKTHLLKKAADFYPAVDLEDLAKHRGSAFGQKSEPQPSQTDFENHLSVEIIRKQDEVLKKAILFEDESRLIGQRHLPENFFAKLRGSKVIVVQQELQERVENILNDYVLAANPSVNLFLSFEVSLGKLEKRLGGLKTQEIRADLRSARHDFVEHRDLSSNRVWIEKLLVDYYDRLYASSLERRGPEVLFRGNHLEILEFLRSF